jgi:DNA-binding transcriptional ArsR family regulator
MAVELGERRSLADLVNVRQSAVVNTFMTMFFIRKLGTPDEPPPDLNPVIAALPGELRQRVTDFWQDAPHDFAEAIVLALRAGVLFEESLEPFLEVFEDIAAGDPAIEDLPSETPADMAIIRAHLADLASSASRRTEYRELARDVWALINASLPHVQGLMLAEAADLNARLGRANEIRDVLPPWCLAFEERIEPLLEPAMLRGELALVPLVAVGTGQLAIALPGVMLVSIARGFDQVMSRRREDAERAAARFKTLSDPTRLQILRSLIRHPASVSRLATHFELSQPTVSAHIKQLREAGLLESVREGASTLYSASPEAVRAWLQEAEAAVTQN